MVVVLKSLYQAAWLSFPVILGGITHIVVIKMNLLSKLAQLRLDGGIKFRGRDLFGENKTVRGMVVMILATVFWTGVLDLLQVGLDLPVDLRYIPSDQLGSVGLGALLGGAYIIGELPNSFLKRQFNIGPGEAATGSLRSLFWLIDQVDSAVAVLLGLYLVWLFDIVIYALFLGIALLVHPAVAWLMVALKLKRRVG